LEGVGAESIDADEEDALVVGGAGVGGKGWERFLIFKGFIRLL